MKKGQVFIEVILIIIFLIIFLIVFNNLSKDTAKTLEKSKILEQENEIIDALYSFIKVQEGLVSPTVHGLDFNVSFKIPEIDIPSKNLFCQVFITSSDMTIKAYDYDEVVTLNKKINLDFTKIDFSKTIVKPCGSILLCSLKDGMVYCR